MPRRSSSPPPKPPDWPPEKTLAALKKQLAELDKFRGRSFRQVEHEETQWKNLTETILTHGFGEDSNNLSHFYTARGAGVHYIGGMSEGLIQQNFQRRIDSFDAMLKSSIAELEMALPEAEIAGVYEPGAEYQFYKDLNAILQAQGYTTYRSPEGADGGADILAGAGPLGFGTPRFSHLGWFLPSPWVSRHVE